MQEVFEEIIEEIRKYFKEKIDETEEPEILANYPDIFAGIANIVKEKAENYNNG